MFGTVPQACISAARSFHVLQCIKLRSCWIQGLASHAQERCVPFHLSRCCKRLSRFSQQSIKTGKKSNNKSIHSYLTPQWHMRFLWFYARQDRTDGSYTFPMEKIWKAEKKLKPRFVTLNVSKLGPQLYSKVRKKIQRSE